MILDPLTCGVERSFNFQRLKMGQQFNVLKCAAWKIRIFYAHIYLAINDTMQKLSLIC